MESQSPWSADGPPLVGALVGLPAYFPAQRWFPGKASGVPVVSMEPVIPLAVGDTPVALIVWRATPTHREGFRFCQPLALVADASAVPPSSVVGRAHGSSDVLIDATVLDPVVENALYEVRYELAHRPAWVAIPLQAVNRRLAPAADGSRDPSA